MKLWLLIIGTLLVYITVSNDAKRFITTILYCVVLITILRSNADTQGGKRKSLVEEGMVRVKRGVGGRRGIGGMWLRRQKRQIKRGKKN